MPTVWFSLKKSLQCKSEPSEVYVPKAKKQPSSIVTRKPGRSGCSRSIANLKDVIHGSKRHLDLPPSCSPRSIGSNEFHNPLAHEVILSSSTCELKITGFGGYGDGLAGANGGSGFVGAALRQGSLAAGGQHTFRSPNTLAAKPGGALEKEGGYGGGASIIAGSSPFSKPSVESNGFSCHKCGEQFGKWEAAESHHLAKHAVTELVEGDSSRKIVEIICRTSWLKSENNCGRIERVLKVHNMQKTLAKFEEYREMVKIKASKLPKKHPRCIADGNELLRFYGTTLSCSLGMNGSSSVCISENCNICRIIRNGFSSKEELKGGIGVFTTSTSGSAFESIQICDDDQSAVRKALLVCRVIAGRVHRPLENIQELAGQSGFDSLAGKVGLYASIEELYLLNPRALLPCFVVICKP